MTRVQRGIAGALALLTILATVGLATVLADPRRATMTTLGATAAVTAPSDAPPGVTARSPQAADSNLVDEPVSTAAAAPVAAADVAVDEATGHEAAPLVPTRASTRPGRSGQAPTLGIVAGVDADRSIVASITLTNPNGFALAVVDVSAEVDGGGRCELTADFPTSIQIGPSVTVPVDAHGTVTITARCAIPAASLGVVVLAAASWDDRRLPTSRTTASATLDLAP